VNRPPSPLNMLLSRHTRRREFITLLGSAAVGWPFAARAQQSTVPVIGYLDAGSPTSFASLLKAFRRGLAETGYVDGQSVTIEYRWGEGHHEKLPMLAADLVQRRVAVIVATGGEVSALAAKTATATIPIVFDTGRDPVALRLVASLNRPGGNATGVNQFSAELGGKSLGLMHELVPKATMIAFLGNPNNPSTQDQVETRQEAARTMGLKITPVAAGSEDDLDAAFAAIAQPRHDALLIGADPLFFSQREKLAALAARYAIPAMHGRREFPEAGGLISYGTSLTDTYRQIGIYTGRILKGEKPSELPVVQPAKFELVINLKTAKALGLTLSPDLLSLADEVIE
jgi:putative tryptophan/tyrosine transport system substrate-binding protein